MKSIPFSVILYESAQLAGLDRANLAAHEFATLRDFADHRLAFAWESEMWPDITRIVSVTPSTDIDGDATNLRGFLNTSVAGDVGDILGIWNKNPRSGTQYTEMSWLPYHNASGLGVAMVSTDSPVFVQYRQARPRLTGSVWSSSTTYNLAVSPEYIVNSAGLGNVQVYYEETGVGDFYYSKTAGNLNNNPRTSTANWSKIAIPAIFIGYLTRGIYADWLRNDAQLEKATEVDAEAEAMLTHEADRLLRQTPYRIQSRVLTR